MPSLDGHTLIRRGDGLGDLDIAIGGHEVHILGGADLALDENHILRIEGNLSFGGGDVALGSDVTPGLDGQVALGADIAVLDNLHILAGNKLATSVVSRNRALDNQVALGGGDCNSIRADSAIEGRIVLCGDGHVAIYGGELREGRVPAGGGGDAFISVRDVGSGDDVASCRNDSRILPPGGSDRSIDLHVPAGGEGSSVIINVSCRGNISCNQEVAFRGGGGNSPGFNRSVDGRVVLRGDGRPAIKSVGGIDVAVDLRIPAGKELDKTIVGGHISVDDKVALGCTRVNPFSSSDIVIERRIVFCIDNDKPGVSSPVESHIIASVDIHGGDSRTCCQPGESRVAASDDFYGAICRCKIGSGDDIASSRGAHFHVDSNRGFYDDVSFGCSRPESAACDLAVEGHGVLRSNPDI